MSEQLFLPRIDDSISRRSLLRGGAAAAALAALPACDGAVSPPRRVGASSSVAENVRVSHDRLRDHVGPSLASNPRHPGQLLVACQGSPMAPEFIATYVSFDAGSSWRPAAGRRSLRPGRPVMT